MWNELSALMSSAKDSQGINGRSTEASTSAAGRRASTALAGGIANPAASAKSLGSEILGFISSSALE